MKAIDELLAKLGVVGCQHNHLTQIQYHWARDEVLKLLRLEHEAMVDAIKRG